MYDRLKILSLFTGIGAFEKALENIEIDYELIGFSEINKYAVKSYCSIHNESENKNLGDITKIEIEKLPRFIDLITHGSPCQDFSIAGNQSGGDLQSGTRSSLMWNTVDIVKWCLPKYVIWENVKNLLSQKHKHNFDNYIQIMDELGYNSYYQILNAKDYEIPQNRERVFTVSIRKDIDIGKFMFPQKEELKIRLKDILEDEVDEKYYLSDELIKKLESYNYDSLTRYNNPNEICNTLTCMQGGHREPKILIKNATKKGYTQAFEGDSVNLAYPDSKTRRGRVGKEVAQTLTTSDNMGVIENYKIRKLTPLECFRLMGFSDQDFEKAAEVNSNSQLYKQAGNSIVVKVLEKIFENLF